jgi:23S rRNA pseudouridine1911/1915/1917 synthase
MKSQKIVVDQHFDRTRIDVFLSKTTLRSRSQVKKMIENRFVLCDTTAIESASYKVQTGNIVEYIDTEITNPTSIKSSTIPLNIVFEDEYLLVINKGAGVVVHPAPGNYENTVVNSLAFYCNVSNIGKEFLRPGIVHRLDKDTSGLMVIAKTTAAHVDLSRQLLPIFDESTEQQRSIKRTYVAVVCGYLSQKSGVVKTKIARHTINRQQMCAVDISKEVKRGKVAITQYKVEKVWQHPNATTIASHDNCLSFVSFQLCTGRTHQIRVHCQYLNTPIIGDRLYGRKPSQKTPSKLLWPDEVTNFPRQALHAKTLSFIHPITRQPLCFESELPDDILGLLNTIKRASEERAL